LDDELRVSWDMPGNVLSDSAGPNVKAASWTEAHHNPHGLAFKERLVLGLKGGPDPEGNRYAGEEKNNGDQPILFHTSQFFLRAPKASEPLAVC
jgi:hypothetical protein